jgi:hypothetical protein
MVYKIYSSKPKHLGPRMQSCKKKTIERMVRQINSANSGRLRPANS